MALTAKRLSPGVYEVNGKRIQATTSELALKAYQKQYGSGATKPPAPKPAPTPAPAPTPPFVEPTPPPTQQQPPAVSPPVTENTPSFVVPNQPQAAPPPVIDTGGLDKTEKKVLDEEEGFGTIGSKIAIDDVLTGNKIGDLVAPDVNNTDFLGRINTTRDSEVNQILSKIEETRSLANTDSPELKFALDTLKQKAQTGLTFEEKEALKANALQGIGSQLQTGLRAGQDFISGRGIEGGFAASAFNPALSQFIQARRGLENDILLAELSERGRALSEFSSLVSERDQNRVQNNAGLNSQTNEVVGQDRAYRLGIDNFNASQRAKEIAARIAKNATGLGILQDTKSDVKEGIFTKEALKANKDALNKLLSLA